MRALVPDTPEMPGMIMRRFRRPEPDINRDAGGAEPRMALPGHFRIGVFDRRHHAGESRRDHGISARRRFSKMRAWLECGVQRGTSRRLACAAERLNLRMRAAPGLGPAAAN